MEKQVYITLARKRKYIVVRKKIVKNINCTDNDIQGILKHLSSVQSETLLFIGVQIVHKY